ncbi:hypothetical protein GN956_G5152 [Arapaima gigas]
MGKKWVDDRMENWGIPGRTGQKARRESWVLQGLRGCQVLRDREDLLDPGVIQEYEDPLGRRGSEVHLGRMDANGVSRAGKGTQEGMGFQDREENRAP